MHDEADGVPAAPLPLAPFAAESSDTLVGASPHAVPRLAVVGVPGDTPAVEQVDAFVGSCADPKSPADAPAAPVARDRSVARTPESVVVMLDRLASASAVGPLVCGAGALPFGADGLVVVEVVAGALALVPGALAVVDPRDAPLGAGAAPVVTVAGSLDEMTAGPTLPPLAVAVPPAAGCSGPVGAEGWTESPGSPASAALPPKWSSAITASV
jgi:hypothetical protein